MKNLTACCFTILTILGLLALSSCRKEGASPENYYLKFKLDGTQKTYSETTEALFNVFGTIPPRYSCSMIGGMQGSGGVYEGMAITISSDTDIAPNITYTNAVVGTLGIPAAYLSFTDETGAHSSSVLTMPQGVEVIITKMDEKSVTGIFSGTIFDTEDPTRSYMVTDGQFYLQRL